MKQLLVLTVLLVVAVKAASGQSQSQPIIDMHMHARTVAVRDADGNPVSPPCFPEGCVRMPTLVVHDGDVMRIAIDAMRRNNIRLGIISDANLDDVARWVAADPQRFWPGMAVLNPARADTAELRRHFEAGRLKVMGELATQYWGHAADADVNRPFFSLAEELDVPLLIHIEGIAGPSRRFRISAGHPERLEEVLRQHPRLRLWLENAGYPFLEEMIALMYQYPQVYVDVSTITWIIPRSEFWRYLDSLIRAGLGKRIMWGSDQMNWPGTIEHGLASIREAPFLSPEQKRDILYNNAAQFLRLDATSGN